MGLNILFWNCQGIRPKRKELELYIKENEIDIVALSETFLNKKLTFKIPAYDTIRNDRSTGQKGGVAFLVKHGLVINKKYSNSDFSIISESEALAINLDLSNNQNLTLATIYCPNGNPNLSLFQTINNLSDNVMFIGDFNSKPLSSAEALRQYRRKPRENKKAEPLQQNVRFSARKSRFLACATTTTVQTQEGEFVQ